MENMQVRTDMASEAHRLATNGAEDLSPLPGVAAREEEKNGFSLFHVDILNEQGAQRLGKPVGSYCTLETERFFPRGDARFPLLAQTLAELLCEKLPEKHDSVLAVGLGNTEITPDALGPLCARYVFPTRHLKQRQPSLFASFSAVTTCAPGVLAASGIESARQVLALCREIGPDCVIVVDALAGAEPERLCRTVQIADSGIAPGSGVGNDRDPLSHDTLGIPVLAIGVPTVIDAGFLGNDRLRGWFLTPKAIDENVRCAARLIGYAIDLALHRDLTVDDIFGLIE